MTRWNQDAATGMPGHEASAGNNWPMRAGKTTLFEGGTRATAFLSAGGASLLPPGSRGTTYSGLMHGVDLTATLLAAAGATHAPQLDGLDHRAAIAPGGPATLRDDVPLNIWGGGKVYSAVRFGHYKYIVGDGLTAALTLLGDDQDGWYSNGTYPGEKPPGGHQQSYLFNISADRNERSPLDQALHAELVAQAKAIIGRYVAADYRDVQNNLPHGTKWVPARHNGTWQPGWADATPQPRVECSGAHVLCSNAPCVIEDATTATCECKRVSGMHAVSLDEITNASLAAATAAQCTTDAPCAVDAAPVCRAIADGAVFGGRQTAPGLVSDFSWDGWCPEAPTYDPAKPVACAPSPWAACMTAPCWADGDATRCQCTRENSSWLDFTGGGRCKGGKVWSTVPGDFDMRVIPGAEYVLGACKAIW